MAVMQSCRQGSIHSFVFQYENVAINIAAGPNPSFELSSTCQHTEVKAVICLSMYARQEKQHCVTCCGRDLLHRSLVQSFAEI